MTTKDRVNIIYVRLQQAFSPSYLEVLDESEQHRGHPGHTAQAGHYAIVISADSLKDLSRLEAHRKIYAVLHDLIPHGIHAVKIRIV